MKIFNAIFGFVRTNIAFQVIESPGLDIWVSMEFLHIVAYLSVIVRLHSEHLISEITHYKQKHIML
jgi:hypothetical protein